MNQDDSQQCEAKATPEEPAAHDSLELLADHHEQVWRLFDQFERIKETGDDQSKLELVKDICREISATTRRAASTGK
jgi:hypothetical protein